MLFLKVFQHILPKARAWSITALKSLRTFWQSLTILGSDFKDYADTYIFDALYSQKTVLLDEWIAEFGLELDTSLTEQQKRDRLAAKWAELGGQSPYYIQTALQNAGFDVYVHDWWLPGYTILCGEPLALCGEPLAQCGQTNTDIHYGLPIVKNPFDYLRPTYLPKGGIDVQCKEPLALCGELQALCGNSSEKTSYPLVNIIEITIKQFTVLCGESLAQCGEPQALCGEYDGYINTFRDYTIPQDPRFWPNFAYVGGKKWPDIAYVPKLRRTEFETLCLKLFPTHLWLGIMVQYV
jgi:hypothetical protein